jgi:hypothetical protein
MPHQPSDLERKFHAEMLGIYEAARRLKPPVTGQGGKSAADALLATSEPSEGFTQLYLRDKRLDLSVEYLVLKNPLRAMFEENQLDEARKRLKERDFSPPPEDAM